MSLTTTGDPNKGIVYLTLGVTDPTTGLSDAEQLSGVLVSPDTVLTAAHGVYTDSGTLRNAGTASVGYNAGTPSETSNVDGVKVLANQDYTSLAGIQDDFALVHLSTPVTNGTIFSLGSDVGAGTFTLAGYPVGTSGSEDTKTESLTTMSGYDIYQGNTLSDGTDDPRGSSGGAVYQTVNGVPTVDGVISAENSANTSQGFFKQLTAADVTQIDSWIAGYDTTTTTTPVTTTPVTTTPVTTIAHSAPGFTPDVASMLLSDAPAFGGAREVIMTDVANAITNACADGGSFGQMVSDASNQLTNGSSYPQRAVAYLAGLLSGTTGTGANRVGAASNDIVSGAVKGSTSLSIARAGFNEGNGMGFSVNTAAPANKDALTLAGVISDAGNLGAVSQPYDATTTQAGTGLAVGSFVHKAA